MLIEALVSFLVVLLVEAVYVFDLEVGDHQVGPTDIDDSIIIIIEQVVATIEGFTTDYVLQHQLLFWLLTLFHSPFLLMDFLS